MRISPMLFLHICCGVLGLISGALAISLRKGSGRHRLVGNVFVISMLGLGASGAYMGFMKDQGSNVIAGTTTFYLTATAWLAGRRRGREPGMLDWAALMLISAVGVGSAAYALAAFKNGHSAGPYLISGLMPVLFAAADIRMLVRGGFTGKQRVVRHLWRMCFAWFFASGSLFLARPHLFPAVLVRARIILLLGILPLILMIFWLFRVRFSKTYKKKSLPAMANVHTLKTQPSTSPAGKTQTARA